jgi:hypothetical protein
VVPGATTPRTAAFQRRCFDRARAACVEPVGDGDAVIESGMGTPFGACRLPPTQKVRRPMPVQLVGYPARLGPRHGVAHHRNLILLVGRDGTARRTAQRMHLQLAGETMGDQKYAFKNSVCWGWTGRAGRLTLTGLFT